MRTVVVNADDFGLSKGVNHGIIQSLHHGILRSASLMPNAAAFEHAVSLARRTPDLGVGLHLSLVGEPARATHRHLGRLRDANGMLPASYERFALAFALRRFRVRQVRAEIAAQVDRAMQTGLSFTHLDSHQHVHLLPGIWEATLQATIAAGINVIRVPREPRLPRVADVAEADEAETESKGRIRRVARRAQFRVLAWLCRRARHQAQAAGLHVVDAFWGLEVSGALTLAALCRFLQNAQPGVNEIMSHPGHSDAALHAKYRWGFHWDAECAALQSPAAHRIVEERHLRLTHFGDAWM